MLVTTKHPAMNLCRRLFSLYTDVVSFFFSFFSKTSASATERKMKNYFLFPPPLLPLRWRSINPLRFIFIASVRWTLKRNRGSVKVFIVSCITFCSDFNLDLYKRVFMEPLDIVLFSIIVKAAGKAS